MLHHSSMNSIFSAVTSKKLKCYISLSAFREVEIKGREYGRLGKLSKFEQIFYFRVKVYISTLSEPWIILIPDLSSNQLGKCCCPKSKVLVPGNTFPRSLSWKLIWASPDSLQPRHPPPASAHWECLGLQAYMFWFSVSPIPLELGWGLGD